MKSTEIYAFPGRGSGYDNGMTLRDYMAAIAMQSYLDDPDTKWNEMYYKLGAREAYKVADAMLEARKK